MKDGRGRSSVRGYISRSVTVEEEEESLLYEPCPLCTKAAMVQGGGTVI